MYSISLLQTSSAEAAWAQVRAGQDLRHALDALDTVAAALVGIAADAAWESDGVRALQDEIDSLRHQTVPVRASLRAREEEIRAMVAS